MRLIDADALKMAFRTRECAEEFGHSIYRLFFVDKVIDAQSSVDAVPVVHGRWKWISDWVVSCSNCERNFYPEEDVNAGIAWYYCPKCGAKMDLEEVEA